MIDIIIIIIIIIIEEIIIHVELIYYAIYSYIH